MTKRQSIKVFEEKQARTVWDVQQEEWYFSIVDVVEILTESPKKVLECVENKAEERR